MYAKDKLLNNPDDCASHEGERDKSVTAKDNGAHNEQNPNPIATVGFDATKMDIGRRSADKNSKIFYTFIAQEK